MTDSSFTSSNCTFIQRHDRSSLTVEILLFSLLGNAMHTLPLANSAITPSGAYELSRTSFYRPKPLPDRIATEDRRHVQSQRQTPRKPA